MCPRHLGFRELRLDGGRSIARDLPDGGCRGIDAYELSDGTWYVGKSVDVRERHQQHLHEWRHEEPSVEPVRMLFCEVGGGDDELDDAETRAIAAFERDGYDLRNLMKTGRPGGAGDYAVEVSGGFGVEIPWERGRRPRAASASCCAGAGNLTENMRLRYERLASTPSWPRLVGLLAAYVRETVPAPDALGCSLWSATAMTRRSLRGGGSATVLCCLSVGNVETLTVFDGEPGPEGFLNMKWRDGLVRALSSGGAWLRRASYRSAEGVVSADFVSLDELGELLADPVALDACYRLNAEMLRRGSCMYAHRSNAFLTDAILKRVVDDDSEHAKAPCPTMQR